MDKKTHHSESVVSSVFQEIADNKLAIIQQLLSEVRDFTFHAHFSMHGDKTLFERWQDADSAITTLRTIIHTSK